MNQRARELWVVPTIIALATGIPLGFGFMFLGLWLAGTAIHHSLSLGLLKLALFASLPVWATLVVLLVTVIITGLLLRQRVRTAEETEQKDFAIQAATRLENQIAILNQEHAAEIKKLNTESRKADAKEDAERPRFEFTSTRIPGDEWEHIEISNTGSTSALDLKLTCDGVDKGQEGILRPGEKIARQVQHNNEPHDFCLSFGTVFGSQWSIVQSPYGDERVIKVQRSHQI